MAKPRDWKELSHEEKMKVFLQLNDEEIIEEYLPEGICSDNFRQQLFIERGFWRPENVGDVRKTGGPPTKATTIGAWRDLSRAEAILELIDNSIDAWMRRRKRYPRQTAAGLMIFIDVKSGLLTYEDNAGGVEEDNLRNLIVPGYSETLDTEHTIGSYRTGGKKAIFKLASEANIRTRYWNPVDTTDEAYEMHLDRRWLTDPIEYDFPYYPLKDKTMLQKGQTVYMFRLHEASADWDVEVLEGIVSEIRRNYTLLMLRNPKIEICFMNRSQPLEPFSDMYKFTGVQDKSTGLDLRPQRIFFETKIPLYGEEHDVTIEIALGCRTTSAAKKGEDGFGIDLYGNNRLFVYREYELFRDWYDLPKGTGARNYVRGFINIKGPNALVPWDTHKRHLNIEGQVMDTLRHHPYIKQLFFRWRRAYIDLSSSAAKATISKPIEPWKRNNDLNIPFSTNLTLTKKHYGVKLPERIHMPSVPSSEPVEGQVEVKLKFSDLEFKLLCEEHDIDSKEQDARKQLTDAIRDSLISQIS